MIEKIEEDLEIPESARIQRAPNGKLLAGSVLNPTGKNGADKLKGRAKWERVIQYYREHCTVDELRKLATDTERLGKMPIEYAQAVMQLAGSLSGKDKRLFMENLYDRLWGYPVQTIIEPKQDRPTQKNVADMTDEEAEEYVASLRK